MSKLSPMNISLLQELLERVLSMGMFSEGLIVVEKGIKARQLKEGSKNAKKAKEPLKRLKKMKENVQNK